AAFANGDHRRLGCAVSEVLFVPDAPRTVRYETVTVVIPTFNRWPILEETLEALKGQTCDRFDVVVVDDGSAEDAWRSLCAWKERRAGKIDLTIRRQQNAGPAAARNRVLSDGRGEILL